MPLLPGLLIEVPSAMRRIRPGQRTGRWGCIPGRLLAFEQRVEKPHRLVEAVFDRRVRHFGDAQYGCPGGGLAERQAAGTARQRQTQQGRAIAKHTTTFDGLGLAG